MNDEKEYQLFEIFGNEKRYVEDDIIKLSNYVVELLNS